MSVTIRPWLERFDVAKALESKIDFSAWKGDEHTKGVLFDNHYGITLNKVMAVRIQYEKGEGDKTLESDLFLPLGAPPDLWGTHEDGSPCIVDQYPFKDMKIKPKKHFLLFDKDKIEKPEIGDLFDFPHDGVLQVSPQPLVDALDSVSNKRDRERSAATLQLSGDNLQLQVLRASSRKKKNILASADVPCTVVEPAKNGALIEASVNAHALMYLLNIFYPFPYVTFCFGRDRILITGAMGDCRPDVEVVVARLKSA